MEGSPPVLGIFDLAELNPASLASRLSLAGETSSDVRSSSTNARTLHLGHPAPARHKKSLLRSQEIHKSGTQALLASPATSFSRIEAEMHLARLLVVVPRVENEVAELAHVGSVLANEEIFFSIF